MTNPKTEPTVTEIEARIKSLYAFGQRPKANEVQSVLDQIEVVPDEKLRTVLFATAKMNLLGRDLKELVIAARHRSFAAHSKETPKN